MLVRFWGTRGSIPAPGPRTQKYGGNTSCTEVRTADGTLIVLDCGTGARDLGVKLLNERPVTAHIFIGHSHWDHIQGFPFFLPAFEPDSDITIYAPAGFERDLEQAMAGQMNYSYSRVKLDDLRSNIHFKNIDEGLLYLGETIVETQFLNHTAPTIGYRITSGGATVVYATDHEPFLRSHSGLVHPGDQRHVEFLRDAGLVIHDAQYTDDEYPEKLGWGHSSAEYATAVAVEAAAERLALFHHDPLHDDAFVRRMEAASQAYAASLRSDLSVFSGAEGMELVLPEGKERSATGHRPLATGPALSRRSVTGARVLIATAERSDAERIAAVLSEDGIVPDVMENPDDLLGRFASLRPGALVLDFDLFGPSVFGLIARLSRDFLRPGIPVILMGTLTEDAIRRAQASGAIDYLPKPFSPPMLHARARAWLLRTRPEDAEESPGPETVAISAPPEQGQGKPGRRGSLAQKIAALAETQLFGSPDDPSLAALADRARFRVYPSGRVVTSQGAREDCLFVVVSGQVRVVGRAPEVRGADMLLGELGPGEVFGELALLDDMPHVATVIASRRTRCLLIDRDDFLAAMNRSPALRMRLLRLIAQRLREADGLLLRDGPDALTGLATRRTLQQSYGRDVALARRTGSAIGLCYVDVNRLDWINRRYGHLTGDAVLQAVAEALRRSTRASDLVARVGDDEFVALLPATDNRGVVLVAERIREELRQLVTQRGLPDETGCRYGYALSSPPPESLEDLLKQVAPLGGS